MTTASLLIVLFVSTVVGALLGLVLNSIDLWYLTLIAGFLGAVLGIVARNRLLARGAGVGPDDSRTPWLVIVYAAIASLGAGSLALEVARHAELDGFPILVGALAGLFAGILTSLLMITYHVHPGEAPTLRSKH